VGAQSRTSDRPALDANLILQAIVENPFLAFYVRDTNGRYLIISRAYQMIFGLDRDQVLGHTASDFMPEALARHVDEVNQGIIASGRPLTTEEAHLIDGCLRHFVLHRVPVRDESGAVVGVFGIATEQTDRVRLLEQTEAMNRVLALFSYATNLSSYAEGLVSLLARLTGLRSVGLRALSAGGAAPFLAQQGWPAALVEAAAKTPFSPEHCPCAVILLSRGTGTPASALVDDHGCVILNDLRAGDAAAAARAIGLDWSTFGFGSIGILPLRHQQDILGCLVVGDPEPDRLSAEVVGFLHRLIPVVGEAVHRFRVEQHLESSRTQLESVVHGVPIPIWVVDVHRRVVFQNQMHRETFGPARDGMRCHEVLIGSPEPCPFCDYPDTLLKKSSRREWRDPRTGRTFDVISVPYTSIAGERQRLEIFFDVTQRIEAEAQLKQTQRLDSLGSLAAGIAHDFNNILTGILGYAQLGLQRHDAQDESGEILQQISQIAERGAELTRKILAFSRRQPLKVTPVDLNSLIAGMRPMLRPLAGDRIEVVLDLEEHLWGIQADRSQIEQVLLNLCVNAAEAMPAGGTLTIRTRRLDGSALRERLKDDRHDHGVMLEVEDTGHGMSPDVARHAIEPFFTTKGRGQGTGLGLSVSYGIVKQHGGVLEMDSVLGFGTTVLVILPAMDITPSSVVRPVPKTRTISRSLQRIRVLLVEDDPPIREMVASLLRDHGLQVRAVADGDEAMKVLARPDCAVDLVITDVAMPGLNGVELARRVRQALPGFPILFMSGCADSTLEQYGLDEAESVLVRKPFTLDELLSAIESVLRSAGEHRATSPPSPEGTPRPPSRGGA